MAGYITGYKAVRNVTKVEQWVVVDGRRHAVGAQQMRMLPERAAEAMIQACKGRVISMEDGATTIDSSVTYGSDAVWLYNTTGNPTLPPTISVPHFKQGKTVFVDVPNPLYTPTILKYTVSMGEEPYQNGYGENTRSRPAKNIEFLPYTRKGFSKVIANWILNRENGKEEGNPPKVAVASAPTDFEPDDTWNLDDVRLYAQLMGCKVDLGPSEADIKKGVTAGEYGEKTNAEVRDECKVALLTQMFFFIADAKYRKPSEPEFEAYKTSLLASKAKVAKNKGGEDLEAVSA